MGCDLAPDLQGGDGDLAIQRIGQIVGLNAGMDFRISRLDADASPAFRAQLTGGYGQARRIFQLHAAVFSKGLHILGGGQDVILDVGRRQIGP